MTTYIICGPTGVGKSKAAIPLAQKIQGRIINADSMQIYEGLPILSAQPTKEETESAPHALYGILPVTEAASVAKWLDMVEPLLKDKKPSVFVGGTGLYIKALIEGLSPIPKIPLEVRNNLEACLVKVGPASFFEILKNEDPLIAGHIDAQNPRRVLRALEVIRGTGTSLHTWQNTKDKALLQKGSYKIILIQPDRETLYDAINKRVLRMIDKGALDEVKRLKTHNISLTAEKTIGLKEILSHLDGEIDASQMVKAIQQRTRNYAKRQITWFQNQLEPDFTWNGLFSAADQVRFLSEMGL